MLSLFFHVSGFLLELGFVVIVFLFLLDSSSAFNLNESLPTNGSSSHLFIHLPFALLYLSSLVSVFTPILSSSFFSLFEESHPPPPPVAFLSVHSFIRYVSLCFVVLGVFCSGRAVTSSSAGVLAKKTRNTHTHIRHEETALVPPLRPFFPAAHEGHRCQSTPHR